MTARRRRVSVGSAKTCPILSPAKMPFLNSLDLTTPPHHETGAFVDLKNDTLASLQALKKDMDHEHVFMVKATEAHTAKLKKRVKQETQDATQISDAIDTDWKNFLSDFEEDTRENQASIESLLSKAQASVAHFSKSCIPDLMKSVEATIDNIKKRYISNAKTVRGLSARKRSKLIDSSAN